MHPRVMIIMFSMFLLIAFAKVSDAATSQQAFIQELLPVIAQANQDIAQDREKLYHLHDLVSHGGKLSPAQAQWLSELQAAYQIPAAPLRNSNTWQALLAKVDEVPASLTLAVAGHESAWGHSRFAKEGNNLFGKWCFSKGCGIVPRHRAPGKIFEVQRFHSKLGSIKSFMRLLNSKEAYAPFRSLRARAREQKLYLKGNVLASGMKQYNPSREKYVKLIQRVIKRYDLERYDHV